MTAEILAIGSELLSPAKTDTNSLFLTGALNELGIRVTRKAVLPDDRAAIAAALRESCARAEVVVVTGGLGPTEDDRTREAAAEALGVRLLRDEEAVSRLRAWFAARQRPMPASNLRQAHRLEGATWLENTRGTAPGQWCPTARGVVVLLPGPARELEPLFAREVRPRLRTIAPAGAMFTRVIRIAGMAESVVDEIAAPIYEKVANPETTILAGDPGEIELRFVASGATELEAQERADTVADEIADRLGEAVFSRDGRSLEEVVGQILKERGETIAVAESCTGGLLGARLTRRAGSSEFFAGGVVCYSDELKRKLVGVKEETLRAQGAVSEQTARELAQGIREKTGADWGVSITGIAGPDGGSAEKPVGTVFIGVSYTKAKDRNETEVTRHLFTGDRERIRGFSVQMALDAVRRAVISFQ